MLVLGAIIGFAIAFVVHTTSFIFLGILKEGMDTANDYWNLVARSGYVSVAPATVLGAPIGALYLWFFDFTFLRSGTDEDVVSSIKQLVVITLAGGIVGSIWFDMIAFLCSVGAGVLAFVVVGLRTEKRILGRRPTNA